MCPADLPVPPRRVWSSRRAWVAHGAVAVWVPGCAVACWWQVGIALSGDALGWAYSVMWPCFAVFGVVVWWHAVHDDPDTVGARGLRRLRQNAEAAVSRAQAHPVLPDDDVIARAEAEDAELAHYNAYLAELAREERSRTWRRG